MTEVCEKPIRTLKVSWSQLQTWDLCQHKANLAKQSKSPVTDIRNFFHGTVCDRIMRATLMSSDPDPSSMPGLVEEFIERCLVEAKETKDGVVRWRNAGDRQELAEHCRVVLRGLVPLLEKYVLPYDYEAEHRFRVPLMIPYLDGVTTVEILLVGGIDVLVRKSENPLVWNAFDLKATKSPEYIRKTLGQAIFYDLSIYAMSGVPPEEFGFFQPAVEGKPYIPVKVTDDARHRMVSTIVKWAHSKWSGEDAITSNPSNCYNCEVMHACKKYRSTASVFAPVRSLRAPEPGRTLT